MTLRSRSLTLLVRHDLHTLLRNRKLLASNSAGVGLIILLLMVNVRHQSGSILTGMFVFAILVGAVVTPLTVAVHSLVGERERRTLEPLMLLPLNVEILLCGKLLTTLLFSMLTVAIVWLVIGAGAIARGATVTPYVFTREAAYTTFILAPITTILFGTVALMVSGRARDAQTALATCQLLVAPVLLVMLAMWMGFIALSPHFLLVAAASLAALGIGAIGLAIRVLDPERLLQEQR
ncbi:MAG: hypothetical protein ABJE47_07520 [bacterium]